MNLSTKFHVYSKQKKYQMIGLKNYLYKVDKPQNITQKWQAKENK